MWVTRGKGARARYHQKRKMPRVSKRSAPTEQPEGVPEAKRHATDTADVFTNLDPPLKTPWVPEPCTAILAESSIPGAGMGLFADKTYHRGDIVGIYEGDVMTYDQFADNRPDNRYSVAYEADEVSLVIDALGHPQCLPRYINSTRGTSHKKNCVLSSDQFQVRVYAEVTRTVEKGEEFFTHYGSAYWSNYTKLLKQLNRGKPKKNTKRERRMKRYVIARKEDVEQGGDDDDESNSEDD